MDVVRNIAEGFRAEIGGRLLYFAASGATLVFLARALQPDAYGLLFLATSILTVGNLFANFSMPKSAAKYVAEFAETDADRLGPIVSFSFRFVLLTVTLVCIGVALLHAPVAALFGDPGLETLLLLGTGYVFCHTFYLYFRRLLQGFKAIERSAAVYATEGVGRFVCVVALVSLGFGVSGALVGYALGFGLAGAVGAVLFYRGFYPDLDVGRAIADETRRKLLRYTVPLSATSGANLLDTTLDPVVLGFIVNPAAVGYYMLSRQAVHFLQAPASAVGFSVGPWFSDQKASGELDRISNIYRFTLVHTLLFYVPAAAGLALLARPAISILFGAEYLPATDVLRVMAVLAVLWSIEEVSDNALDYLGRARARSIARATTAVASLALIGLLVPVYGVVGAAVAKVIGHAAYVVTTLYIMHTEVSVPVGRLMRQLTLILAITAIMSVVVFTSVGFVSGAFTLAGVIALGGGVWIVLAVSTGVADVQTINSYFN
ncbi:oligosaccharide flippase family protein [Halorussus halophilus]|uniref:oligosaccharide flippase family protein n=1 Tax=Halorussus halophilus TaxID=2650975 RepID=UPI0013016D25|nr:oligosaccharide flippase family protein [Halorussus halophilus]